MSVSAVIDAEFFRVTEGMGSAGRDRTNLCSLVYPETRLVEFVPGYVLNEDPMNLALRAALDHGIELVEELLGLKNPVESVKGVEHAKAFAARSLSAANYDKLTFSSPGVSISTSTPRSTAVGNP